MRKLLLGLALIATFGLSAQDMMMKKEKGTHFIISAGYAGTDLNIDGLTILGDKVGVEADDYLSGVYLGVGGVSSLSKDFSLDYGVTLASRAAAGDNTIGAAFDTNLRWYPAKGFFIKGGAGVAGLSDLDDLGDFSRAEINAFRDNSSDVAFNVGTGLGLHLTKDLILTGNYIWQVNDAIEFQGNSFKAEGFNVGLQYQF